MNFNIPLEGSDLDFLRDLARQWGIQYFNARFSQNQGTNLALLKGISHSSNIGIDHGFSIQAFSDGGYALAIGQDFNQDEITATFQKAAKMAKWSASLAKKKFEINVPPAKSANFEVPQQVALSTINPDEKMRLLIEMEKEAKDFDARIIATQASYADAEGERIFYNSNGQFIRGHVAASNLYLQAIAKEGVNNQQGYTVTDAGKGGFEIMQKAAKSGMGSRVAENAIELLAAKPIKAGKYDIIMDSLLCGTFIHEAFGHACEADAVLAGESILKDKIGQKVGNPIINIVDDGTIVGASGSLPYDDEGTPTQKTVLVKKGIMRGYLHSLETASKMKMQPTGNARASNYTVSPIVRMRNTYLEAGNYSLDELFKELKNGLFCVSWMYGYVEPSDGSFQFKMKKAYQIENGEKTQIFRDAAISGMTLDVLNRITAISKEFEMDNGTCGKDGQYVPVTSGGGNTLIKNMVIGGQ